MVHGFSEFLGNFWNFRQKKTKKSLVLRISRYTIWEVRYDILFDIRKSPICRHSINSRSDKLCLGADGGADGDGDDNSYCGIDGVSGDVT